MKSLIKQTNTFVSTNKGNPKKYLLNIKGGVGGAQTTTCTSIDPKMKKDA